MNKQSDADINYLIFIMLVLFFILSGTLLCSCSGPRGYTGSTGATGQTGPQGPSISVLTQPATSLECPTGGTDLTVGSNTFTVCNGAIGVQGDAGATGAQGSSGTNGTNGTNGTDGTVITPIQFCAGLTPTYPSSFPEYGLVINGVVYGVYSANGGFLAVLPPGNYSSDGINASCNFTINSDGTVSQ